MKKLFVLATLVVFYSVSCFAGGPLFTPSLEEIKTTPKKAVNIDFAAEDLYKTKKQWTFGLGIGGNPLIGMVEKDGFGYPRNEAGICTGIGFAMTTFSGQPSQAQIKAAVESIKAKNGNFIDEKKLPSMVREELGVKSLNYVGIGILNLEMGTMWIINDNMRTRLGFGLPTLISFGVNWDF